MSAQVEFRQEQHNAEGNYGTLVTFYGCEYSVLYVANEIRLYGTSRRCASLKPWQQKANHKAITAAVREHIQALGPEFQAAHEALYAEEVEVHA